MILLLFYITFRHNTHKFVTYLHTIKSEDAVVASELNLTRFSLRILHYGLQLSLSRLFVAVTPLLSSHDQTAD